MFNAEIPASLPSIDRLLRRLPDLSEKNRAHVAASAGAQKEFCGPKTEVEKGRLYGINDMT